MYARYRATLSKVLKDPSATYEVGDEDEELETTPLERTDTMRALNIQDKQRFVVSLHDEEDEESE